MHFAERQNYKFRGAVLLAGGFVGTLVLASWVVGSVQANIALENAGAEYSRYNLIPNVARMMLNPPIGSAAPAADTQYARYWLNPTLTRMCIGACEKIGSRVQFIGRFALMSTDQQRYAFLKTALQQDQPVVSFERAAAAEAVCEKTLDNAVVFLDKAVDALGDEKDVANLSGNDFAQFDAYSRAGLVELDDYVACLGG